MKIGDEYVWPEEWDLDQVRAGVESQAADHGHEVRGSTMPYFSIDTGDSLRYDLLYTKPEEGVKAVAVYDIDAEVTEAFYKIQDLVEGDAV